MDALLLTSCLGVGVAIGAVAVRDGDEPMTMRIQLVDYQPQQEGVPRDEPFPDGACAVDANFPAIEGVSVNSPEGELLGLPDGGT